MQRNFFEFICKTTSSVSATNSREPLTKSFCHGFGLGFAGLFSQFFSEAFGFRITDVQSHRARLGQHTYCKIPKERPDAWASGLFV